MTRPPQRQAGEDAASLRSLLRRPFWLWLAAMMLHWFCFAPYQYGFTLFLQEQHVPTQWVGMIWSVGVGAEIVAFDLRWFFKRMPAHQVLTLALAASLIRWTLLGLFPNPYVIVATQLLHGPSFALYYAAAMQELGDFAGKRFHASLQGLFATGVNGVAYCLGTTTAGILHTYMPFHSVILLMIPAECGALFLLAASRRHRYSVPVSPGVRHWRTGPQSPYPWVSTGHVSEGCPSPGAVNSQPATVHGRILQSLSARCDSQRR